MTYRIPLRTKSVEIRNPETAIALPLFAAQRHVSYRTVYYWLRTRRIMGFKTGGRWYVQPSSLAP
jgi:hypothetical protein